MYQVQAIMILSRQVADCMGHSRQKNYGFMVRYQATHSTIACSYSKAYGREIETTFGPILKHTKCGCIRIPVGIYYLLCQAAQLSKGFIVKVFVICAGFCYITVH